MRVRFATDFLRFAAGGNGPAIPAAARRRQGDRAQAADEI